MDTFSELDDRKYYLHIPDANFSPARNKAIIKRSIQKQNEMIKKKGTEFRDAYMERSDAVVSYLRKAEKNPGYAIDRYFDKKYLTFLRGDDIRRELMSKMTIYDSSGKLVIPNF
jgi:hypothetical protein